MRTLTFVVIIFTVILNIIWMRKQSLINRISLKFSNDSFLRNCYEVIVQPKWFNYGNYYILILWPLTLILGLLTFKWKFLLIIPGLYFGAYILSKILPLPPKKFLVKIFKKTVRSRFDRLTTFPEYEQKFIQDLYVLINDDEELKKI